MMTAFRITQVSVKYLFQHYRIKAYGAETPIFCIKTRSRSTKFVYSQFLKFYHRRKQISVNESGLNTSSNNISHTVIYF